MEWAQKTWQNMRQFSTGGVYVNFLTEEETGQRIEAASGRNLRRLAELKAKWDPSNLFHVTKNLKPSGS